MSKIKYSKKFITKAPEQPRSYVIYQSFHEDYNTFYVWMNRVAKPINETRNAVTHSITLNEHDDIMFVGIFGENIHAY